MNRLENARCLHNSHLSFKQEDGTHIVLMHITKESYECDEWELGAGIFLTISKTEGLGGCSPDCKDWRKASVSEVLRLMRTFPKRHEYQCAHRYDSGAICTSLADEHYHCAKCDVVCHGLLCHDCRREADMVRAKITKDMADYQNTYNIPFRRDEELWEHMTCDDDGYETRSSHSYDREDFHADG